MKRYKALLTIILQIISIQIYILNANAYENDLSRAFADFIMSIYSNTQTTNKANSICIYGSDDISAQIVATNDRINIITFNDNGKSFNTKDCRIIYIAKSKEKFVKFFISNLAQSPNGSALTIAVFDSFISNGGTMFIDVGRRGFEPIINLKVFKASGIRLDSSITNLIVNN